jgi:hypothetical protein
MRGASGSSRSSASRYFTQPRRNCGQAGTAIAKATCAVRQLMDVLIFHHDKKSATDAGLIILAGQHPRRIGRDELIEAIKRNGFKLKNAKMAVSRLAKFVDYDGAGQLRLLAPGLERADERAHSLLQVQRPLWVTSRHMRRKTACPLYPRKQTLVIVVT